MSFSLDTSRERRPHGEPCRVNSWSDRPALRPSQAALSCAYSELLSGNHSARQTARTYLRRHAGEVKSLPGDVLRAIVSTTQESHVVHRLLRELRNHPRAIERSTPVLAHLMHHGEGSVAVVASKLLGSIRNVRDASAIPVLTLRASGSARHHRVAGAFEENLRGEDLFDLEVYKPSLDAFRTSLPDKQARLVYQARGREWYESETGRAVVLGALVYGSPHVQRLALETLLALNYSAISESVRLPIETLLGFTARKLVSDGSPRINRDLFMRTAANLEHSAELASIFLESAHHATSHMHGAGSSLKVLAKLYYGAAVLSRFETSDQGFQQAIQGLSALLKSSDTKVLGRIAKRVACLSAELPVARGEEAVSVLLGALRERSVVEAPEQERRVLIRAVHEVSGYDSSVVDFCARLLAECEGPTVERVIAEILRNRLNRMLEDSAIEKSHAILSYLGERRHGRARLNPQSRD